MVPEPCTAADCRLRGNVGPEAPLPRRNRKEVGTSPVVRGAGTPTSAQRRCGLPQSSEAGTTRSGTGGHPRHPSHRDGDGRMRDRLRATAKLDAEKWSRGHPSRSQAIGSALGRRDFAQRHTALRRRTGVSDQRETPSGRDGTGKLGVGSRTSSQPFAGTSRLESAPPHSHSPPEWSPGARSGFDSRRVERTSVGSGDNRGHPSERPATPSDTRFLIVAYGPNREGPSSQRTPPARFHHLALLRDRSLVTE